MVKYKKTFSRQNLENYERNKEIEKVHFICFQK